MSFTYLTDIGYFTKFYTNLLKSMSLTILLVQQFKAISLKQNSSTNIKMKATSKDNRCLNL